MMPAIEIAKETTKNKSNLLSDIDQFFYNDSNKSVLILFYQGHGDVANGEWSISHSKNNSIETYHVSNDEVFNLWKARKNKSKDTLLLIHLDSCHSAYWCK